MLKSVSALLLFAGLFPGVASAEPHTAEFWRGIVSAHYAVPHDESADALAHELSGLLGSPDPELRDDLAYTILGNWILHGDALSNPTLVALADEWRANLKSGLGDVGTNSVLKRSFSALCLSEMARREARSPFLGAARYHSLVAEAIAYMKAERDLRGYDPQLHWIHATAHTADLLGRLANNSMLASDEASAILDAIATRLSTATQVYTQGEQDRMAAAVVSVIRRKDFQAAAFSPWLARLQNEDRDVWTATTPESLARYQNHNYLLQALTVRILLEKEDAGMQEYSQQVLAVLSKR